MRTIEKDGGRKRGRENRIYGEVQGNSGDGWWVSWFFACLHGLVAGGYRVTAERTRQLGTGSVSVYL